MRWLLNFRARVGVLFCATCAKQLRVGEWADVGDVVVCDDAMACKRRTQKTVIRGRFGGGRRSA